MDEIGSPGWQIHPAILPNQQDLVLRKPETDAFYGTSLREEFRQKLLAQISGGWCSFDSSTLLPSAHSVERLRKTAKGSLKSF